MGVLCHWARVSFSFDPFPLAGDVVILTFFSYRIFHETEYWNDESGY